MLPVEAKPLLAEEHSSSATETAESERSTSARTASPPPTRISIARDWGSSGDGFGQSSYTDLVSLAKEANAAAQGGATSRNQLGAINVRTVLTPVWSLSIMVLTSGSRRESMYRVCSTSSA
jgi:hypothetical protein